MKLGIESSQLYTRRRILLLLLLQVTGWTVSARRCYAAITVNARNCLLKRKCGGCVSLRVNGQSSSPLTMSTSSTTTTRPAHTQRTAAAAIISAYRNGRWSCRLVRPSVVVVVGGMEGVMAYSTVCVAVLMDHQIRPYPFRFIFRL